MKNVSEVTTINPATEEILNTYTVMTKEEVIAIVNQTRRAYEEWDDNIVYFRITKDVSNIIKG
ncbi:MAG TPA: hypothetical protein VJ697_10760 [Nitrososphaeraceae archaeon]|nr:hypothetical protein [Nitrososphaeraceae archaeon]